MSDYLIKDEYYKDIDYCPAGKGENADLLLVPRFDYDIDEILEFYGMKTGPMNEADNFSDEYLIYSFLVLAREALLTQNKS